jgi:hypothetical protein
LFRSFAGYIKVALTVAKTGAPMKLTFRGWRREVYPHVHKVIALPSSYPQKPGRPLKWTTPTQARGRINGLALTGDFQVDFEFTEAELKNWLMTYLEEEPEKAFALISKAQVAAVNKILKGKK